MSIGPLSGVESLHNIERIQQTSQDAAKKIEADNAKYKQDPQKKLDSVVLSEKAAEIAVSMKQTSERISFSSVAKLQASYELRGKPVRTNPTISTRTHLA